MVDALLFLLPHLQRTVDTRSYTLVVLHTALIKKTCSCNTAHLIEYSRQRLMKTSTLGHVHFEIDGNGTPYIPYQRRSRQIHRRLLRR